MLILVYCKIFFFIEVVPREISVSNIQTCGHRDHRNSLLFKQWTSNDHFRCDFDYTDARLLKICGSNWVKQKNVGELSVLVQSTYIPALNAYLGIERLFLLVFLFIISTSLIFLCRHFLLKETQTCYKNKFELLLYWIKQIKQNTWKKQQYQIAIFLWIKNLTNWMQGWIW